MVFGTGGVLRCANNGDEHRSGIYLKKKERQCDKEIFPGVVPREVLPGRIMGGLFRGKLPHTQRLSVPVIPTTFISGCNPEAYKGEFWHLLCYPFFFFFLLPFLFLAFLLSIFS